MPPPFVEPEGEDLPLDGEGDVLPLPALLEILVPVFSIALAAAVFVPDSAFFSSKDSSFLDASSRLGSSFGAAEVPIDRTLVAFGGLLSTPKFETLLPLSVLAIGFEAGGATVDEEAVAVGVVEAWEDGPDCCLLSLRFWPPPLPPRPPRPPRLF